MLSDSNARLAAARRLTRRRGRGEAGRFLAEGAQAVSEALRTPGAVVELFATAAAQVRYAPLLAASPVEVSQISDAAAAALSETVTPQGLIAVCRTRVVTLDDALHAGPGLVVVLVEPNDPGNAGAILRTADAAGARAVVFAGDAVDPYNGKAVRASAGSVFHVDVVTDVSPTDVFEACMRHGLQTLATTGGGVDDLDELIDAGVLSVPTAWVFGNEARGLAPEVLAAADRTVRVPIHGYAESLNLAAAAAVCLYASARAQR